MNKRMGGQRTNAELQMNEFDYLCGAILKGKLLTLWMRTGHEAAVQVVSALSLHSRCDNT